MSGQWHPDTEALAEYRAGLIGGLRRRRLAAHVAGCAQCASVSERLDAVGSVLASVPAPVVPDEVERRITAALAAEATARQDAARQDAARQSAAPSAGPRRHRRPSAAAGAAGTAGAPGAPGSGRGRARHPQRRRRFRPIMTLVPAAACLLLAGFGYLLSNTVGPSGPGGAVSAASAPSATSAPAARAAEGSGTAGSVPRALAPAAGSVPSNDARAGFVVIASGTRYQRATLEAQVRHQMAVQAASHSAEGQPGASGGFAPSQSLVGCALRLTRNEPPSLVDRATYQGIPAYVIAVPDRAWVVGLGCTASNPAQITSIPLG
jgi:hypothetical protein